MKNTFLKSPLSIALILGMSVSIAFADEKREKKESSPKNNTGLVGPALLATPLNIK